METTTAMHTPRSTTMAAVRIVCFVLLLIGLTGCATEQIGKDFDETKLSTFKPHQTTLDEVVAALGQPTERETESDGSVRLHYEWIKGDSGLPVVNLIHPTDHTDAKDAYIYFGPDGRFVRAEQNEMHNS